ncbi:hypothetical protein DFH09DRAFT_1506461 [Mycena vulgaris]|nr:hypothetical protein DFH09DRAFT_1506461 [Mycena vulgaris]
MPACATSDEGGARARARTRVARLRLVRPPPSPPTIPRSRLPPPPSPFPFPRRKVGLKTGRGRVSLMISTTAEGEGQRVQVQHGLAKQAAESTPAADSVHGARAGAASASGRGVTHTHGVRSRPRARHRRSGWARDARPRAGSLAGLASSLDLTTGTGGSWLDRGRVRGQVALQNDSDLERRAADARISMATGARAHGANNEPRGCRTSRIYTSSRCRIANELARRTRAAPRSQRWGAILDPRAAGCADVGGPVAAGGVAPRPRARSWRASDGVVVQNDPVYMNELDERRGARMSMKRGAQLAQLNGWRERVNGWSIPDSGDGCRTIWGYTSERRERACLGGKHRAQASSRRGGARAPGGGVRFGSTAAGGGPHVCRWQRGAAARAQTAGSGRAGRSISAGRSMSVFRIRLGVRNDSRERRGGVDKTPVLAGTERRRHVSGNRGSVAAAGVLLVLAGGDEALQMAGGIERRRRRSSVHGGVMRSRAAGRACVEKGAAAGVAPGPICHVTCERVRDRVLAEALSRGRSTCNSAPAPGYIGGRERAGILVQGVGGAIDSRGHRRERVKHPRRRTGYRRVGLGRAWVVESVIGRECSAEWQAWDWEPGGESQRRVRRMGSWNGRETGVESCAGREKDGVGTGAGRTRRTFGEVKRYLRALEHCKRMVLQLGGTKDELPGRDFGSIGSRSHQSADIFLSRRYVLRVDFAERPLQHLTNSSKPYAHCASENDYAGGTNQMALYVVLAYTTV